MVMAKVNEDQWGNQTPCDKWNVSELTAHVVATHQRVYATVDDNGVVGLRDGTPVGEQWAIVANAVRRALSDPDLAKAPVQSRGGEQPFASLVEGLLMFDTLCHTWDLARAIGADETVDGEAVAIAHSKLGAVSDAIRVPGGFAHALTPAPDANPQTRFLTFTGRAV